MYTIYNFYHLHFTMATFQLDCKQFIRNVRGSSKMIQNEQGRKTECVFFLFCIKS